MRAFVAALLFSLFTLAVPAGAQQVSHDWTVVNKSEITLTWLEMATGRWVDGKGGKEFKTTEKIRLGENLPGDGQPQKVTINPKTKICEWTMTYYAVDKGGGSSVVDLCGKSRIIVATRPGWDLPEVSAE